jgi:hypothetical protein
MDWPGREFNEARSPHSENQKRTKRAGRLNVHVSTGEADAYARPRARVSRLEHPGGQEFLCRWPVLGDSRLSIGTQK